MSTSKRRLAAAGHAGDAGEQAERDFGGDVFQIVAARADDLQQRGAGSAAGAPGSAIVALAGEIFAGQRIRRCAMMSSGVPCGDDVAAVDAGAGADVDHVVGDADRVLVVLDHDHGVAEVAQPVQRFEKPRVVALVQADRRLVEHVEHAGQPGADLRGEADALALAAGQRAGGARERQIFEPDVDQEFQPLADFLEHAHGDLVLLGGQPLG